jgi:hypothetical protein
MGGSDFAAVVAAVFDGMHMVSGCAEWVREFQIGVDPLAADPACVRFLEGSAPVA